MDPKDHQDASDEEESPEKSNKPPAAKKKKLNPPSSHDESTDSSYVQQSPETIGSELSTDDTIVIDDSSSEDEEVVILDEDGLFSSETDGISADNKIYKIRGLLFGSGGGTNTCTIDPFLTTLKIWLLRSKYDFVSMFKFEADCGGKKVESIIKEICARVQVTDQDSKIVDSFRLESFDIQTMWMQLELGPDHGRLPNEVGSTDEKTFSYLRECAEFTVTLACDCLPNKNKPITKSFVYIRNQAEANNFTHFKLLPCRKFKAENPDCPTCHSRFSSEVTIPDTTWLLRFKLSWLGDITDTFPESFKLGGVAFRHAVTLYHRTLQPPAARPLLSPAEDPVILVAGPVAQRDDPNVIVSGHQSAVLSVKNRYYEYDDMQRNGRLELRRLRQLSTNARKRTTEVIYFRIPPRKDGK